MSNWILHTRWATSQIYSPFLLRCFPWVWSPCPMTTGSIHWTHGCGMGWASFPLQLPRCCERRESCQKPRAAATAHHQTGAQGSSHLVPCAGVCVCVYESVRRSGLGTCITLFVFVSECYITLFNVLIEGVEARKEAEMTAVLNTVMPNGI